MKNFLKAIFIVILFQVFMYGQNYSYFTYGPTLEHNPGNDANRYIGTNAGNQGVVTYITIVNWHWTYDLLPTEGVLDSIIIRFQAQYKDYSSKTLGFTIHYLETNWSETDYNYYQNQITHNNNRKVFDGAAPSNSNGLALCNFVITGGALFDSIKTAINSGRNYITLAFRSEDGSAPWWGLSAYGGSPWEDDMPAIELTLKYKANIQSYQFVNKIENSENSDSLVVKNIDNSTSNKISSGTTMGLTLNTNYSATTNLLPFVVNWNSTGNTEKHSSWIANSNNNYAMSYNFKANLNSVAGKLTSNFTPTKASVIQANLVEGNINNIPDSIISLKDPWYYSKDQNNNWINSDIFKNYPSPLNIQNNSLSSYGGVFLNQNPQFQQGIPSYSVKAQQTQNINLGGALGTRAFYFQNWSGTNVNYQDSTLLETPLVFTNDNAVATANYKGHLLSNNSTGFSSNSQRKFISDNNGYKHLVYDSQGSVWYTKSTDNGTTWLQDVKLNEDDTQAKGAVIATTSDGYLYILYQCDYDAYGNSNPAIILAQFYFGNLRWQRNVCDLSSYTYNTMPVISAINGVVLVVYKPSSASGLVSVEYYLSSGNIAETHVRNIPGTTQSSTNPSLATTILSQPTKHMLVYQESYYGIYYKQWTVATDFGNLVTSNLTSGVGYSLNYTPSIVDVTTGSRLCWVGSDYSGANKRVVFRDPENLYQFWTFGNLVASPSINKTDANTAYFIGWSDGNGTSFKIVDNHLSYSYIKTLTGLQGSAMQLSNGGATNTMYAMTFYNGGLPYPLTQSNSLASYYSMSKENTNSNIASGRAGIVMKGEGEFSFMLGDIEVNSEKIRFKKLSDTLTIPSKDVFNTLVESETFELKENSSFTYSVEYGVTDSAIAVKALQNGENVKFKVELVDAVTNQIINTFDNVTYTKDFLQKYNSLAYQVNTEAIGTMNVKLRLVADHSGDANYLINNSFVEDEIIAKKGFKVINLKNELQIKDYALAQNYPNPFNPATTITYQLPKSGSVTLKIFDILGNEVKTLVNEQQEMGRYTVQFDASSLASGMYVYQLRANDYTSTKKMLLLK